MTALRPVATSSNSPISFEGNIPPLLVTAIKESDDLETTIKYLITLVRVLNFAILARQYFAGFYFHDSNRQI